MTPKNTLREVFSHLGADVSTINWNELGFHHFEPAQRLFDAMPPPCRAQADLVFRQIHLLACREGMDAINEATEMRHKGTHQFGPGSATNRYERAALVWMADQELFEQAVSLFGLRQLPWWRIKRNLPRRTIDFTDDMRQQFETRLEQFFMARQNRGEICTVELKEPGNGVYYFFAYPDDYPKSVLQHNDLRTLFSQTFRPTFEVVFAYNSKGGTLEICGKVSHTLKGELENLFIETILDSCSSPDEKKVYDLSVLKNPDFVPWTDPWDMVHVAIEAITVYEEKRHKNTFDFGYGDDFFEDISQRPHHVMALEAAQEVRKARFRFDFHAKKGREPISIRFEIGEPSRNTLGHHDLQYVRIINMYLERWGITHERTVARVA